MAKDNEKIKEKNVRPPIITIMGHVDHGKTSLLDAIRESSITATETGGITQHTGAYNVIKNGKKLTFIDTPGHEAFTQMRARGGKAADIVILVVAADDGVMPQTKEAIMHAKSAEVPIVVALNKIDLPGANPLKVKKQLADAGILVEGYGGDIVTVEVSATKKIGLENLLEVLTLTAEMNENMLVIDPHADLEAMIIEARHDSKRGILVAAVVKTGNIKLRDDIIAGKSACRVKQLINSDGKAVSFAETGDAVEILGFTSLPEIGDTIRKLNSKSRSDIEAGSEVKTPMQDITSADNEPDQKKKLNLIIRADTSGTLEAIVASLQKITMEDASVDILLGGTGDVKESDILLASTSKAIILAFRIRVPSSVKELAKSQKVIVREHDIIYKLLEEIEGALEGVVEIEEAKIKGRGFVIKIFTLPKSGMMVIGTLIEAGKFKTKDRIGIFREDKDTPLYISRVRSLHLGAKEVEVAHKGDEVGILLKPQIADIKLDDTIEVF
jgi:translation initiation factor IF-2